jgi:hypothetical protein
MSYSSNGVIGTLKSCMKREKRLSITKLKDANVNKSGKTKDYSED